MKWTNVEKVLKDKPSFRKDQVKNWVFKELIRNWDEAINLPKDLRKELKKKAPLKIKGKVKKGKGVAKARLDLNGSKVETVLMKHEGRNTVCVSSQVGCPVGCAFCLTGKKGFSRNLAWDEIVAQVLFFERKLKGNVTNVVFMGMGEPFLNYEEVIKAAHFINKKDTFNIGARRISISTVGIPEKIERFGQDPLQANLAFSLHAPNDNLRSSLIPINKKYPLKEVFESLRTYLEKKNRKIMVEYVLIKDVNDSLKEAEELVLLLKENLPPHLFMVNLITYNPTGDFKPSSEEKVKSFKKILEKENLEVTIRERFGKEIKGACGQLA